MSEEEIKLIEEMKENCIKQANYVDVKAMEKYNTLRHLQQENSQLKENNVSMQEEMYKYWKKAYKLQQENSQLKKRIEKAIEYIEDSHVSVTQLEVCTSLLNTKDYLLEMLKGDNK